MVLQINTYETAKWETDWLCEVLCACNPSTRDADAAAPQVCQGWLSETVFQNKKIKTVQGESSGFSPSAAEMTMQEQEEDAGVQD